MRNLLLGLGATVRGVVALGVVAVCGVSMPTHAQVKPRIVVGFDTSGSMAFDVNTNFTFGISATIWNTCINTKKQNPHQQ